MASIGRLALSAVSGTQEATMALVNANFDFSIVKMEAPVEYRELGNLLSPRRRREAEDGQVHVTARKLGALFADDLPAIPHLIRAYGIRASEITGDPNLNPCEDASAGPFRGHVGIDATSIWAAATSGRGALHVHLLACLLARIWSGPEAISIWSELVAARSALLKERIRKSDEFSIATVTASQIEVTRERLAEWDASARSVSQLRSFTTDSLRIFCSLLRASFVSGSALQTKQGCANRNKSC